MFRKIVFFSLVVGGCFNVSFGYQNQTEVAEDQAEVDYACNDLIVNISAIRWDQTGEQSFIPQNHPIILFGISERMSIYRLSLLFQLENSEREGENWSVPGSGRIATNLVVPQDENSDDYQPLQEGIRYLQDENTDDYQRQVREVTLGLIREAVSDGLANIAGFIDENCESIDENRSLRLGFIRPFVVYFRPVNRQGAIISSPYPLDLTEFVIRAFDDQLTSEYLNQFLYETMEF